MCGLVPAAVVAGIASVASTGAAIVSEAKAAKAQTKALREQYAASKEENKQAASAELFDSMRAARREQGKARAQAGESGLSLTSGSVEAMLIDSAMQAELREDRILANMEARHRADTAEAESIASRIQKPTALGAGLRLTSAGLNAWGGIEDAKVRSQVRKAPTKRSTKI